MMVGTSKYYSACNRCDQMDNRSGGIKKRHVLVIPQYVFEVQCFIRVLMEALPSWKHATSVSNCSTGNTLVPRSCSISKADRVAAYVPALNWLRQKISMSPLNWTGPRVSDKLVDV